MHAAHMCSPPEQRRELPPFLQVCLAAPAATKGSHAEENRLLGVRRCDRPGRHPAGGQAGGAGPHRARADPQRVLGEGQTAVPAHRVLRAAAVGRGGARRERRGQPGRCAACPAPGACSSGRCCAAGGNRRMASPRSGSCSVIRKRDGATALLGAPDVAPMRLFIHSFLQTAFLTVPAVLAWQAATRGLQASLFCVQASLSGRAGRPPSRRRSSARAWA